MYVEFISSLPGQEKPTTLQNSWLHFPGNTVGRGSCEQLFGDQEASIQTNEHSDLHFSSSGTLFWLVEGWVFVHSQLDSPEHEVAETRGEGQDVTPCQYSSRLESWADPCSEPGLCSLPLSLYKGCTWWCVGDGAVPEDAQMLQDLVLSHCLSWGWWTTKNAAQCSEGCIVRAAVEPWTDPTYTLCYVCGLCLFLPFFWVPSLALIIAQMVWKPRQGSGQHCCASPFCITGTEILGAPCGTCISLLSLVTQKPWKSLLLFLSQTLFQHLWTVSLLPKTQSENHSCNNDNIFAALFILGGFCNTSGIFILWNFWKFIEK